MAMPDEKTENEVSKYEGKLDVHGPLPAFNEDGVDLTQVRETLAMTPLERLIRVQSWAVAIDRIRVVRGSS
jgi:hypothetical protein